MKKLTTSQLLANSLLELSANKDVDKITIKEIVENCGLSSQTFYNHFADKYALMLWIHKSVGDELIEKLENGEITPRELSIHNLEFYSNHTSFILNALHNTHGADSYRIKSAEDAIDVIEEFIKRKFGKSKLSMTEKQHLRLYVYGVSAICENWAETGAAISLEDMSDIIMDAMPDSLKKYIRALPN